MHTHVVTSLSVVHCRHSWVVLLVAFLPLEASTVPSGSRELVLRDELPGRIKLEASESGVDVHDAFSSREVHLLSRRQLMAITSVYTTFGVPWSSLTNHLKRDFLN